jgi:hypothetical protein
LSEECFFSIVTFGRVLVDSYLIRFIFYLPIEMATLPYLGELQLEGNNVIGTVPSFLDQYWLRFLLSDNQLEGPIPQLNVSTLVSYTIRGNSFKCPMPNAADFEALIARPGFKRIEFESNDFDSTMDGRLCGGQYNVSANLAPIKVRPIYKKDLRLPSQRQFSVFSAQSKTIRVEISGTTLYFFIRYPNGTVFRDEYVFLDFQGLNMYCLGPTFRVFVEDIVVYPAESITLTKPDVYTVRFPLAHTRGDIGYCDFILEFNNPLSPMGVKFSLNFTGIILPTCSGSGQIVEAGLAFQLTTKAPVIQPGDNISGKINCDLQTAQQFYQQKLGCQSPLLRFDSLLTRPPEELFLLASIETQILSINFTMPFIAILPTGQTYFVPLTPAWYFVPYGKVQGFTDQYRFGTKNVSAPTSQQGMSFTFELRGSAAESFYLDPTVDMRFLFSTEDSPASTPEERQQTSDIAVASIVGGIIGAVAFVAIIAVIFAVPSIRHTVLPFLGKREEGNQIKVDVETNDSAQTPLTDAKWQAASKPN